MASSIEKTLARRILYYKGSGIAVPNDVARSARLVLDDKGTPEDVQKLRQFQNIKKIGFETLTKRNSFIKGFGSALRSASVLSRDTQLYSLASQGDNPITTGLAASQLAQDSLGIAQDLVKSRPVKEAASTAFTLAGSNALQAGRFLQGMNRFIGIASRLLGPAALAYSGVNAIQDNFRQAQSNANLASQVFDLKRNFNNPEEAARLYEQAYKEAERRESGSAALGMRVKRGFNKTLNICGLGVTDEQLLETSLNKEAADLFSKQANTKATARRYANQLGINVNAAIAEYASNRGIPLEALTDKDKNDAIDNVLSRKLDPKNYEDSRNVNMKLQAEGYRSKNLLELPLIGGREILSWIGLAKSNEEAEELRRSELARAEVEKIVLAAKKREDDLNKFAEDNRARRARNPEELRAFQMQQQESIAKLQNHLARRRIYNND